MQYKNITSILLLHKKKAASLRPLSYYIIYAIFSTKKKPAYLYSLPVYMFPESLEKSP